MRCGCSGDCSCVIAAGDCIIVTGNGNAGAPYVVGVEIDPVENNQLICGDSGLYVDPPTAGDCIDIDPAGAPPVISVLVDPLADNRLACNVAGLYVPGISVAPGDCVDLSGDGSVGDPLATELVLSADPGNTLECRADGAFVPAVAQGAVDMRATIVDAGGCPTILPPALITATSRAFIDYDVVEDVVGLAAHVCGATGAYPHTSIEVPAGGDGIYLIQATHPAWSTNPTSLGDIICRLRLWKGTTAGGAGDGIGQSGQVRYSTSVTNYNTPYLHVTRMIELVEDDVVFVSFDVEDYGAPFGGATLDSGPTYGNATGSFDSGYAFFQMTRIGTA